MYETMTIDAKTLIVKSDNESELAEVMDFIAKKGKEQHINSFLKFASGNRKIIENYKFNREECYGDF
jgi:hypothetical protein